MKKLIFTFLTMVLIVSCSSDDENPVNNNCTCYKIIYVYNEQVEAFDPISSEYYSDNCDDRTGAISANPEQEDTYYGINCTPNP